MRWPHSSGMTNPWWWHWGTYTVSDDEVISINVNTSSAEPSGISEYKVVLVWFPDDLHSVADVTVSLWDTCAPGGEILVGQDNSYDYLAHLYHGDTAL